MNKKIFIQIGLFSLILLIIDLIFLVKKPTPTDRIMKNKILGKNSIN